MNFGRGRVLYRFGGKQGWGPSVIRSRSGFTVFVQVCDRINFHPARGLKWARCPLRGTWGAVSFWMGQSGVLEELEVEGCLGAERDRPRVCVYVCVCVHIYYKNTTYPLTK